MVCIKIIAIMSGAPSVTVGQSVGIVLTWGRERVEAKFTVWYFHNPDKYQIQTNPQIPSSDAQIETSYKQNQADRSQKSQEVVFADFTANFVSTKTSNTYTQLKIQNTSIETRTNSNSHTNTQVQILISKLWVAWCLFRSPPWLYRINHICVTSLHCAQFGALDGDNWVFSLTDVLMMSLSLSHLGLCSLTKYQHININSRS